MPRYPVLLVSYLTRSLLLNFSRDPLAFLLSAEAGEMKATMDPYLLVLASSLNIYLQSREAKESVRLYRVLVLGIGPVLILARSSTLASLQADGRPIRLSDVPWFTRQLTVQQRSGRGCHVMAMPA